MKRGSCVVLLDDDGFWVDLETRKVSLFAQYLFSALYGSVYSSFCILVWFQ